MAAKKKEIRKNIDLPKVTVDGLEKLAEADRTHVKPYMEKVIIEHEAKKNKSQS